MTVTEDSQTFQLVMFLITTVFGGIVTLLTWFITHTLSKIDKNQTKLFDTVSSLAEALAQLRGEHDALVRQLTQQPLTRGGECRDGR